MKPKNEGDPPKQVLEKLTRWRRRSGILYATAMIFLNVLLVSLLGYKLYNPIRHLNLGSVGLEAGNIWVSIAEMFVDGLGLALASSFSFGIAGLMAALYYPLIPSSFDPLSLAQWIIGVSLLLPIWYGFYDGLWVISGRKFEEHGLDPMKRSLRTYLTGGKIPVRGILFVGLFIPFTVMFEKYILGEAMDLSLIFDPPRASPVGVLIMLSPLLGVEYISYLVISEPKEMKIGRVVPGLAYTVVVLLSYFLTSNEGLSVTLGFISTVLVSKWRRGVRVSD